MRLISSSALGNVRKALRQKCFNPMKMHRILEPSGGAQRRKSVGPGLRCAPDGGLAMPSVFRDRLSPTSYFSRRGDYDGMETAAICRFWFYFFFPSDTKAR